jgi:hypothetical protein
VLDQLLAGLKAAVVLPRQNIFIDLLDDFSGAGTGHQKLDQTVVQYFEPLHPVIIGDVKELDQIEDAPGRRGRTFLLHDVFLAEQSDVVVDDEIRARRAILDHGPIHEKLLKRLQGQLKGHGGSNYRP